jgi:tRNA nucleotidyltransferase (CCA-adding enzyme)
VRELTAIIPPELRALREKFVERGFDLRLVGGCVRDLLRDETPKDIDLCTDADPEEQMTLYRDAGVAFYETGLKHGTLTVNLGSGGLYEITSLRTETNHDGRHADVTYTRDWLADLGRRDLTVNAMALTFDGELIDHFGGADDLVSGRARFVGDADQRLQEDYLRILRFFRFHARIASTDAIDSEELNAIRRHHGGLRTISKERVWSEMAKIIAGPFGPQMLVHMTFLGVDGAIDLPAGDFARLNTAHRHTSNPVTLMTAYLGDKTDHTGGLWRWSTVERQLARFLTQHMDRPLALTDIRYMMAVERVSQEYVRELGLLRGDVILAYYLKNWTPPVFPVTGHDLMQAGVDPGPALGQTIAKLKQAWANMNYAMTKDQLMALVTA